MQLVIEDRQAVLDGLLPVRRARLTVEYHQHRRRAEGPVAARVDADRSPRHPFAGVAMIAAHGGNVVYAVKLMMSWHSPR